MTRFLIASISLVFLAGCAASRQEVASRLGEQFIGPERGRSCYATRTAQKFLQMNNCGASYVWQLAARTDVAIDQGYKSIRTRVCKVSVVADAKNIVTQRDRVLII
jgi:hypothetical protein